MCSVYPIERDGPEVYSILVEGSIGMYQSLLANAENDGQ